MLLRKDVLVLRRSPLLLGILIAYPLAIALLVGLVAGYASSKPRVALVDRTIFRRPWSSAGRASTSTDDRQASQNVNSSGFRRRTPSSSCAPARSSPS